MKKKLSILYIFIFFLFINSYSQELSRYVIGNAGLTSSSYNLNMNSTAGEAFISESSNYNTRLYAGFWNTVGQAKSFTWTLAVSSNRDYLVADGFDEVEIYASFVDAKNPSIILTTYTYTVTFNIYCGSRLRNTFYVNPSSGTATLKYKDTIAGEMTVVAFYSSISKTINIKNLVGPDTDTAVWCSQDSGLTQVLCPAGTFTRNTEVRISRLQELTLPPYTGIRPVSNTGRSIEAFQDGLPVIDRNEFHRNMTLIFYYSESGGIVEGIQVNEELLRIYRVYNNNIDPTDSTVDTLNNKIISNVSHLSIYFIGWAELSDIRLYQNYPNPFYRGQVTNIRYEVNDNYQGINIFIYNTAGELVKKLIENIPGEKGILYTATWDGTNENGEPVSTGVYICRLSAEKKVKTIKIAYIKE